MRFGHGEQAPAVGEPSFPSPREPAVESDWDLWLGHVEEHDTEERDGLLHAGQIRSGAGKFLSNWAG